jgi:iron-regulated transporter 1
MALQSFFELLSFACTIVFARPEQFKYPVLVSYGALGVATVCYAVYVRRVRGHLVHVSRCMEKRVGTYSIEHIRAEGF